MFLLEHIEIGSKEYMLAKTIAVAYKAHPYADNWDELGRK